MKVSVITVSFNSGDTIKKTFESVKNQNYNDIELIIVDGGSNDSTLAIIEDYKVCIDKFISEPDNGIYDAMNKGVKITSGDIIGILNSDDIYASDDIISSVVNKFKQTNCDILYGNINYKNKKGETVRIWDSSLYLKGSFSKGWHPPHPSLFVKKSVYDRCGLFDTDFKIAADFEFMLRVFEKNDFKISYLNENLVSMLVGGKSNTLRGIISGQKEIKMAFKKNNIYLPKFYFVRRYLDKLKEYLK
jgi:glycosyltransferase involved in cell wall biosynthesis